MDERHRHTEHRRRSGGRHHRSGDRLHRHERRLFDHQLQSQRSQLRLWHRHQRCRRPDARQRLGELHRHRHHHADGSEQLHLCHQRQRRQTCDRKRRFDCRLDPHHRQQRRHPLWRRRCWQRQRRKRRHHRPKRRQHTDGEGHHLRCWIDLSGWRDSKRPNRQHRGKFRNPQRRYGSGSRGQRQLCTWHVLHDPERDCGRDRAICRRREHKLCVPQRRSRLCNPNNVNLAITRNSTSFASVAQTQISAQLQRASAACPLAIPCTTRSFSKTSVELVRRSMHCPAKRTPVHKAR